MIRVDVGNFDKLMVCDIVHVPDWVPEFNGGVTAVYFNHEGGRVVEAKSREYPLGMTVRSTQLSGVKLFHVPTEKPPAVKEEAFTPAKRMGVLAARWDGEYLKDEWFKKLDVEQNAVPVEKKGFVPDEINPDFLDSKTWGL